MPKTVTEKPKRLYFESYIQVIKNSVGSNIFRNFYVSTAERGKFDALDDGDNSCAFFVSSILVIFQKIERIHGLVSRVIEDLERSGWQKVNELKSGDVLVWEAQKFDDGWHEHIGFYIGDDRAVSTSRSKKTPAEHDKNYGEANRNIIQIYRMPNWDD